MDGARQLPLDCFRRYPVTFIRTVADSVVWGPRSLVAAVMADLLFGFNFSLMCGYDSMGHFDGDLVHFYLTTNGKTPKARRSDAAGHVFDQFGPTAGRQMKHPLYDCMLTRRQSKSGPTTDQVRDPTQPDGPSRVSFSVSYFLRRSLPFSNNNANKK